MTRYPCCDPHRLNALKHPGAPTSLNAIEYLEVRDTDEPDPVLKQRTLFLRLIRTVPTLTKDNVVITGGERIVDVGVEWVAPGNASGGTIPAGMTAAQWADLMQGVDEPDHVLVVRTTARGDFSRYRLRLVNPVDHTLPPTDFDPVLSEVDFWFKIECPSDFDCAPVDACQPQPDVEPTIDYLVKDYQGFRRLMLERMALLAPDWTERNPADIGVMLIEALAYVADELSYRQDSIATEAYLNTARSRISLRRHARLVDYRVHEGCNARAWVHVQVDWAALAPAATVAVPRGTKLLSRMPGVDTALHTAADLDAALAGGPIVFETVADVVLHPGLDELRFYTWGDQDCCLPRGATAATLLGAHQELTAGDVLVLAEVRSPTTGVDADADPAKRVAVRLVGVQVASDPAGGLFADPQTSAAVDVTEIQWHPDDALTFPLCLSARHGELEPSMAWGNIALADHGLTVTEELPAVPPSTLFAAPTSTSLCADSDAADPLPVRYRPALTHRPTTSAVVSSPHGPLPTALTDAASLVTAERPRDATPWISLVGTTAAGPQDWNVQPDLLASDENAADFTVECEHDGTGYLRFGDDDRGRRPEVETAFSATYRIGNGRAGNVGAGALAHIAITEPAVTGVSNPLPASGGVDPESADEIRRDAPHAFAVQHRAVTAADYADAAQKSARLQRAAATFRWTGSWHTVFVTADRPGGVAVDPQFATDLRRSLEDYRMAGYDLEVDDPEFVSLEVGLLVCVSPDHLRQQVGQAVLDVLSNRALPDGRRGLFHQDNFTFGQPVYLSGIYAAVQTVPGVDSVDVQTFQRQRYPETSALDSGMLAMGRLEIARLDNDPNFPERGVLALDLGGGR